MKKVSAWHFVRDDGSRAQDGVVEEIGKTYTAEGDLVMCENGMHACERIIDALDYALGARLRRVECWGEIMRDTTKFVCRNRKPLWEIDATMILHRFAISEAERMLRKAKVTDKRCWDALEVKKRWLAKKATDEELADAWDAVPAAALDAATVAAVSAALDAARASAWAAARAAARDAALDAANTRLTKLIEAAHKRRP